MPIAESIATIVLLGVLFLGMFVGFILGMTLFSSNSLTLKIASSVVSAALAGAPVAFMSGLTFERWMYPIGLVLGLAWVRMFSIRTQKASRSSQTRLFAWLDMLAIIGATLVVIVTTALLKP
jgi:hypothetical protein